MVPVQWYIWLGICAFDLFRLYGVGRLKERLRTQVIIVRLLSKVWSRLLFPYFLGFNRTMFIIALQPNQEDLKCNWPISAQD